MESIDYYTRAVNLYRTLRDLENDKWYEEYPVYVELRILKKAIKESKLAQRNLLDLRKTDKFHEFQDSIAELNLTLNQIRKELELRKEYLLSRHNEFCWFNSLIRSIQLLFTFNRYKETEYYTNSNIKSFRDSLIKREKENQI